MSPVERRQCDQDQLTPEVLALLLSCGARIRATDLAARAIAEAHGTVAPGDQAARPLEAVVHQVADPDPESGDEREEERPRESFRQRLSALFSLHVVTSLGLVGLLARRVRRLLHEQSMVEPTGFGRSADRC
jgi:hypothetical protein